MGLFTWGLMIWAAVAYRRRHRDDVPEQTKYNVPIEILYTVVPLIMILGLFWFTASDQSEILAVSNDQDQTVNVVGFRWNWGFNYLDEDAYTVGTPNLPASSSSRSTRRSASSSPRPTSSTRSGCPAFLFKMDVIPGKTNVFELTPDKVGTYAGKCAELCGVDHARMLFNVQRRGAGGVRPVHRRPQGQGPERPARHRHEQRRRPDAR